MACEHFENATLCRCRAVGGLLVPSLFERERYCLSDEPARCPTFATRALRGETLPEEVYYALWLPGRGATGLDVEAAGPVPEQHTAGEAL